MTWVLFQRLKFQYKIFLLVVKMYRSNGANMEKYKGSLWFLSKLNVGAAGQNSSIDAGDIGQCCYPLVKARIENVLLTANIEQKSFFFLVDLKSTLACFLLVQNLNVS